MAQERPRKPWKRADAGPLVLHPSRGSLDGWLCSWPKPRSVSFSALHKTSSWRVCGTALCLFCCLSCSSPPSKALHQGTGKRGKDMFLPALPHLSHAPSTSYQCLPGATECAAPVLDSLQQPLCPKGFGKVGVSLSGGQLSGWDGRADGEEACRVGDSWGDRDVFG